MSGDASGEIENFTHHDSFAADFCRRCGGFAWQLPFTATLSPRKRFWSFCRCQF